jgi:hypothetical protein
MREVRSRFGIATAVAIVALGACGPGAAHRPGDDDSTGDDDAPGTPDASDPNAGFIDAAPFLDAGPFVDGGALGGACEKIDILFVVDNSGSMAEEQAALATAFPQFVSVIENYTNQTGQHLDYHIAITTTDITFSQDDPIFGPQVSMWNDGKFVTGNCQAQGWPNRRFLQKGDSNVSAAFSCAAHVGTDGSGLEMPLEAAKEALIDRVPAPNAGFIREDALLAIVMLTDENDCSVPNLTLGAFDTPCVNNLEPIPNYVAKLDTLKGGHGRWATAVIAIPPGAGPCGGDGSSENVRLKAFTDAAGANGVFANICTGNMAQSLMQAFDTFGLACENIPPVN